MDELSDIFKKAFRNLHHKTSEKHYQHKNLKNRMDQCNNLRRETRNTLMLHKRNIDLNTMSPYSTPESARTERKKICVPQEKRKNIRRLDMLNKWKEEKEKRKQDEMKKAKPIFKVCHIPVDVGLPNLENVNKQIKGKQIKHQDKPYTSTFAPSDHKFRAPSNIKPINITSSLKTKNNVSQFLDFKGAQQTSIPTSGVIKSFKFGKVHPQKTVVKPTSNKADGGIKANSIINSKHIEINSKNSSVRATNKHTSVPDTKQKKHTKKINDTSAVSTDVPKKMPKLSRSKCNSKKNVDFSKRTPDLVMANRTRQHFNKYLMDEELQKMGANDMPEAKGTNKITCSDEMILKTPKLARKCNNNSVHIGTPIKSKELTPTQETQPELSAVYISPFVTVSRGKASARKEYKVRSSTGGTLPYTPELGKQISSSTGPKAGAEYFSQKLKIEIERIQNQCNGWNKYKEENKIPEEAVDMIDVAVGQSTLLITKKFKQFSNLIEECRSCQYKEKPITCKDLHGFWDMIYMQVEDLEKRFNNLEVLKSNDWQEIIPEKKVATKRTKGRPKKITASSTSSLKDIIKAARKNHRISNKHIENISNSSKSSESGDFQDVCNIQHSVIEPNPSLRSNSMRRSLRVSLLFGKTLKRASASPGLTMAKVTQAIKTGDGITPSKSILKTDLTKSETRITKSVLFKDLQTEKFDKLNHSLVVNKENDLNKSNMIEFSPGLRRSSRLNKVS